MTDGGRTRRILIDAGPNDQKSYGHLQRKIQQEGNNTGFELFVLTHIDADHIGGAIKLLNDESIKIDFGDIWFKR